MNRQYSLKPKVLAKNLAKSRDACGKSLREISKLTDIPTSRIRNYEKGNYIPTLPELESLSYIYRIPVFALMDETLIDRYIHSPNIEQLQRLIEIRQGIISTRLVLAREEKEITYKNLSKITGITKGRIKRYETGQSQPPLNELISLSIALEIDFSDFEDQESPVGLWQKSADTHRKTDQMSKELVEFFIDPENTENLNLARKLADIGIEKLTNLKESLLTLLEKISPEDGNDRD